MNMRISPWLAIALVSLVMGVPAFADNLLLTQVQGGPQSSARPMADEKCIEQCDTKSDQCMQAAEGDSAKLQDCDDKYSECLKACEGG